MWLEVNETGSNLNVFYSDTQSQFTFFCEDSFHLIPFCQLMTRSEDVILKIAMQDHTLTDLPLQRLDTDHPIPTTLFLFVKVTTIGARMYMTVDN